MIFYRIPRHHTCPSGKVLQSDSLDEGNGQNCSSVASYTPVKGGNWLNTEIIQEVLKALFENISHNSFQSHSIFIMLVTNTRIKHAFLPILLQLCHRNSPVFCGILRGVTLLFLFSFSKKWNVKLVSFVVSGIITTKLWCQFFTFWQ